MPPRHIKFASQRSNSHCPARMATYIRDGAREHEVAHDCFTAISGRDFDLRLVEDLKALDFSRQRRGRVCNQSYVHKISGMLIQL